MTKIKSWTERYRDRKAGDGCANLALSNAVEDLLWAKDIDHPDAHYITALCGKSRTALPDGKWQEHETITVWSGPQCYVFATAKQTPEQIAERAFVWWLKTGRFPPDVA